MATPSSASGSSSGRSRSLEDSGSLKNSGPLKVGICGLGTVAQGVLEVLKENGPHIARRAGRPIEVVRVASRSEKPGVDLLGAQFSTDLDSVLEDDRLDVVVELIGGEDVALEVVRAALEQGRSVVTANKAILARHGNELFTLARERGGVLAFEAAVAGGIPIIAAMTRSLASNRIGWLAGIINGTSNFILTAMNDTRADFAHALAEAQALGYAEADPTFDVEGIDAAHKLTILAALAFGIGARFEEVYTEGIASVTTEDMDYAHELGYRIKHLGLARRTKAGVELRVHPTLIPERELLASVDGVMNAVLVSGNAAGRTLYYGAGAGARPTASAVVADLVDIARGGQGDYSALPDTRVGEGTEQRVLSIGEAVTGHYLKIPSLDRPGVFAKVATILSENDISIEGAIQKEQAIDRHSGEARVPIIILTQAVAESVMLRALAAVQALPEVVGTIGRIRVEHLTDE